ncbi:hypothetical protein M514_00719 [Trichuris suis]|uniref:Uncharacterized protein n=1 Tax=Trichuris suis TaxID=68888 RepID=A0A085N6M6_9BILA|nr:hypothetical protein M514_00719 [Trichuris suis]
MQLLSAHCIYQKEDRPIIRITKRSRLSDRLPVRSKVERRETKKGSSTNDRPRAKRPQMFVEHVSIKTMDRLSVNTAHESLKVFLLFQITNFELEQDDVTTYGFIPVLCGWCEEDDSDYESAGVFKWAAHHA